MASFSYLVALVLLMALPASKVLSFDPMAPPGAQKDKTDYLNARKSTRKKVVKDSYILRQIVIHNHARSAVINGYIVNEGSFINNAQVQKIEENSVVIKVLGKRRVLTLEPALPNIRR